MVIVDIDKATAHLVFIIKSITLAKVSGANGGMKQQV
jgi:hypothetical protein